MIVNVNESRNYDDNSFLVLTESEKAFCSSISNFDKYMRYQNEMINEGIVDLQIQNALLEAEGAEPEKKKFSLIGKIKEILTAIGNFFKSIGTKIKELFSNIFKKKPTGDAAKPESGANDATAPETAKSDAEKRKEILNKRKEVMANLKVDEIIEAFKKDDFTPEISRFSYKGDKLKQIEQNLHFITAKLSSMNNMEENITAAIAEIEDLERNSDDTLVSDWNDNEYVTIIKKWAASGLNPNGKPGNAIVDSLNEEAKRITNFCFFAAAKFNDLSNKLSNQVANNRDGDNADMNKYIEALRSLYSKCTTIGTKLREAASKDIAAYKSVSAAAVRYRDSIIKEKYGYTEYTNNKSEK